MPRYCERNCGFRVSFIANLVARKLDTEVPSNPHFICSKVLHNTNHSTVARFVNDELKALWPTGGANFVFR
jgi:hypothetical protein